MEHRSTTEARRVLVEKVYELAATREFLPYYEASKAVEGALDAYAAAIEARVRDATDEDQPLVLT